MFSDASALSSRTPPWTWTWTTRRRPSRADIPFRVKVQALTSRIFSPHRRLRPVGVIYEIVLQQKLPSAVQGKLSCVDRCCCSGNARQVHESTGDQPNSPSRRRWRLWTLLVTPKRSKVRELTDVLFSSLYSLRARPGSVRRWRASPGVQIHSDMLTETRVAPPTASGPHVAMCTVFSSYFAHNIML